MKRGEAFKSKYLGKDDLADGPVIVTIEDLHPVTLKDDDGHDESKTAMTFSDFPKPWLVNFTNWMTCEDAYGEESDDWIGRKIEIFVDPTVMMKGKRTGGVRCRIPTTQQQAAVPFDSEPATPVMTYDDALANCFDVGITKEELVVHLKANGQTGWNAGCGPLARQLIDATLKAKKAAIQPTEDDTQDLVDDIPF
jgi:hypothetical protein